MGPAWPGGSVGLSRPSRCRRFLWSAGVRRSAVRRRPGPSTRAWLILPKLRVRRFLGPCRCGRVPSEPCRSLLPEGWLAGAGSGLGLLLVVSPIRSSYRRIVEAGQYGVPSLPVHPQLSLNGLQGTRVVLAPFHVGAVGAHVDAVLYGAPFPTDADATVGGRADVGRA